jgi:hypothetical protein
MTDREYLREMAKVVEAKMPDNYGFIVLAFPLGVEGRLFYTSNCRREDAIKVLKEWLFVQGEKEAWMRHIE